jgi:thioredoxin reductase (NADPH)
MGGELIAGKRVGYLADGTKIIARASICATGVDYRRLGLPNEEKFVGAGVYCGAGASEAMFCGGEHVYLWAAAIPWRRLRCNSPMWQAG